MGNLKALRTLNLDKNQLKELPSTVNFIFSLYISDRWKCFIRKFLLKYFNCSKLHNGSNCLQIGGCISLTILSLRDNLLEKLPLEIGRLENLRVLDVCNNRLNCLPFTINVLFKLQALWLSENQVHFFRN